LAFRQSQKWLVDQKLETASDGGCDPDGNMYVASQANVALYRGHWSFHLRMHHNRKSGSVSNWKWQA